MYPNFPECGYCGKTFHKDKLDEHVEEKHKERLSSKRKLVCCDENEKKRRKSDLLSCHHCECVFRSASQRLNHFFEVHDKDLRKERQQKDDDLVLNYVKTNKLDEYQLEPDRKPDFEYIFQKYQSFEKEEWLAMMRKFDIHIDLYSYGELLGTSEIINLLEYGILSMEDTVGWMDYLASNSFVDYDHMEEMVGHFLTKNYEIKREWVAAVIVFDGLIERIKEKYTFTFDEIYEAKTEFNEYYTEEEFYEKVHKHFPDPNFKEPPEFKMVSTRNTYDYFGYPYFYDDDTDDDEEDELWVKLHCGREISLGSCKELLEKDLPTLIEEYEAAIEGYDEAEKALSAAYCEIDEIDDDYELTDEQQYYMKGDAMKEIRRGEIPTRNDYANLVSKLYFVISMKPVDEAIVEANERKWQETPRKTCPFKKARLP